MPYPKRTAKLILSSFLLCALLPACDKKEEKKEDKKEEKTEADKEVEERLAKKRAERAAAEEAAKKEQEDILALATLPEEMPKDLEAACDAAATAQDEFMKKHYEGEALAKWEGAKSSQLQMMKATCAKAQSIEIPACQANAMNNAPAELKKKLPDLLKACIDKFGGAGDAAAPPAQ
jgi:hypothetical protein